MTHPVTNVACAFIGLGSNLGDPAKQLQLALEALSRVDNIDSIESSPWYCSRALGPGEQPDYINAVARIATTLSPEALLSTLQAIENQQGRVREVRWGARTLDLDLLLYDNRVINTDKLIIPHPQMAHRSFVLKPLYDLAPELYIPNIAPIAELLEACDMSDLSRARV